MDLLIAISISVGILSGVWYKISVSLGLLAWVGFIGCTSFYGAGGKVQGWKNAAICGVSGIFWAMMIIHGGNFLGFPGADVLMVAIVSGLICAQAKIKALSYIPGAFAGCASTFGANGNWQAVLIALLLGTVLGIASETGGILLHKWTSKNNTETDK